MKALAYTTAHGFDAPGLELLEVDEPSLRGTDLLVEIRAIGVNPGEALIRRTRSAAPGGRVILGWEFAGIVTALGAEVTGFTIGDRVMGTGDLSRDGCWAERLAVDHRVVTRIPEGLSFADAASVPIGGLTAWEALFRERDQLPAGVDSVLVIGGAGGVGSFATQLLKARTSSFVIATASRPESREWCLQMGADRVVDHGTDVLAQLGEVGIQRVDLVFSTTGTEQNMGWIARLLRPHGHLCVIDAAAPFDASALVPKSASLHTEMVFSKQLDGADASSQGRILRDLTHLLLERRLRPITTARLTGLTVDTLNRAQQMIETRRTVGKIVVDI
ncbi:MAG: zinc-binding alcohol dehydrogenase family protein [Cystobacter sp.]